MAQVYQYTTRSLPSLFLVLANLWGITGVMLAVLMPARDWLALAGVLMVSQSFCAVYVRQRFQATRKAVLPDLLTMYLFNLLISKTVTLLGLVARYNTELTGIVGTQLSMRESVSLLYQYQAELVFLLAALIFFYVGRWFEGQKPLALWHEPSPRLLWIIYTIGVLIYFGSLTFNLGAVLGQIPRLFRLFALGALAVLLGGRSVYALGSRRSILALLALAPLLLLALRSGMKGEVALVFMPVLLPIFRRLTLRGGVFLAGFLVFVLLFVFPFSHTWRQVNWFGQRGADVETVAAMVVDSWQRNGMLETAAESTSHWLRRGSSAEAGGLVMQIAERDGHIGPELIKGLATIFIPRFLWPNKPSYRPGAWFTWYLGEADSPETANSSTAMMLPTELYWMFGIVGVVGGMAVLACIYMQVWIYISRRARYGIIPMVALFALLMQSSDLEGTHTLYAISGPIIFAIYISFLDLIQKVMIKKVHFF